eukprot:scaffold170391_cov30-Tisochrysis_lutea.AAC.3
MCHAFCNRERPPRIRHPASPLPRCRLDRTPPNSSRPSSTAGQLLRRTSSRRKSPRCRYLTMRCYCSLTSTRSCLKRCACGSHVDGRRAASFSPAQARRAPILSPAQTCVVTRALHAHGTCSH